MTSAKVIPITPKLLLKQDAMKYVGLERTAFEKLVKVKGLSVYAYGSKKVWYKVSELDELLESFLIIKKAK